MIEVILDHSYEDDYLMVSEVLVNISDVTEKERIEKLIQHYNIEGYLIDVGESITDHLAEIFEVDRSIINIDTNEIDLM